jgi:hypothetical protein
VVEVHLGFVRRRKALLLCVFNFFKKKNKDFDMWHVLVHQIDQTDKNWPK